MPLSISYRGPRYLDRTLALETREVAPNGVELIYETAPSIGGSIEALRRGAIDAAEVLLGDFVSAIANNDDRLVGLPIFPARRFAQRFVFVAHDADLNGPGDLDGRRLGWPPGAATAAVWVRALVDASDADAEYVMGPIGGSLARILDRGAEGGETLPERLAAGKLDGLITPYPVPPDEGGDRLRLLLAEPGEHEQAQVRDGGYFPIANVVVIRHDLYDRHRWIACALVDAFAEAKVLGSQRLNYFGALAVGLPWLSVQLEEIDRLFGDGDAYPYGLEANRAPLEAFARHAAQLGVTAREIALDELFAPEVLDHPGVPDTTDYDVPMAGVPRV
jgi:4,5-dihydroxyphthalate decarboxylase